MKKISKKGKSRNAVKKYVTKPCSEEGKVDTFFRGKFGALPYLGVSWFVKELFWDTVCSWVLLAMSWGIDAIQQHWFPVPPFVINHLPLVAGCITTLLIGGALNSAVPVWKWGIRKLRS
ncbi:hypothetical protein [Erwinia rhapontici]|uniref:hypothetical protein n=1 Tax=Erwinia rhapontici TaxID=55212 RepID=UPI00133168E0|nr:hypothetical protein [Erwinia rhapontici]MBP2157440.1 hypothetical protein [Erwinia rhapontici]